MNRTQENLLKIVYNPIDKFFSISLPETKGLGEKDYLADFALYNVNVTDSARAVMSHSFDSTTGTRYKITLVPGVILNGSTRKNIMDHYGFEFIKNEAMCLLQAHVSYQDLKEKGIRRVMSINEAGTKSLCIDTGDKKSDSIKNGMFFGSKYGTPNISDGDYIAFLMK